MRFFKPHREVLTDPAGNSLPDLSVTVAKLDGGATVLYGDMTGAAGAISNTLRADKFGEVRFWARDGIYRLTISFTVNGTAATVVKEVVIGSGGTEETGLILLADYLNASGSNALDAFAAAFDVSAEKRASGKWGRAWIECEGAKLALPSKLVLPGTLKDTVLANFVPYPTGTASDWTMELGEAPNDDAFWAKYETATDEGKTFARRHPLIQIDAGNIGLTVQDVYPDGKGDSLVRLSAGWRVLGNTADRRIVGGKTTNVETCGVFIGHDSQNSAQIDIEGHEIKPNGRETRLDRTAYGIASGGNDMHWRSLVVSNCHCPLLMGESGATTMMLDCDLFNGGRFELDGNHHRLVEYHGNSNTFTGGRSGNGIWHVWNPDILIGPTKFGVTEGTDSGDPPPSAFIFYATEADQDLTGWIQLISETPIDLVTDIQWYSFETDGGTWAMGTDQLESLKGHISASGRGKNFEVQLSPNQTVKTFVGPMTGAVVAIRDDTTDEIVGPGALGNALQLWAGDAPRWKVQSNKHLVPMADNDTNIGDASARVRLAYINAQPASNTAPTLANNEWGVQRVSNTVLRWHFRGSDGTLRTFDIGPFA